MAPGPADVDSPAAYVAALRALRVWSGLSYRQLERRAQERGESLPHSTLAVAFARDSLPRAEVVVAFVRACGLDEDAVARWLSAHRRLAAARADIAGQEPEVKTGLSTLLSRRGRVLAVVCGAVVVGMVAAVALTGGPAVTPPADKSAPMASPQQFAQVGAPLPQAGALRLRAARSDQCLSELRGSGSGHLYERPCAEQFPAMTLELISDNVYRMSIEHPEFGPGCMGIPFGSTTEGTEVEDGSCGKGAIEEYRWESVASPAVGYRIHPIHNGLCLGFPPGSEIGRVSLRQLPCDSSLDLVFQPQ